MIQRIGDVTIGTRSGAVIMSTGGGLSTGPAKQFANPLPSSSEVMNDVAMWGSNNLLPQEMANDIEATGVLSAAIDAKARISIGKGPMPARVMGVDKDGQETLEFVNDPEITDWLSACNAFETAYAGAKDLFGWGNSWTEVLLSYDRKKLLGFKRHDPTECRFSKKDPKTRRSESVYLSGDWRVYANYDVNSDYMAKVPLLDKDFPLMDLQSRTSGYNFMIATQYPLFGRQYYSPSPWYSAQKWVKIAQGIPEMKAAMFNNQMTLKCIVEVHPSFWKKFDLKYETASVEQKQEIQNKFYDHIDQYLVGGNNAYKSVFSELIPDVKGGDPTSAIKITAIDDKIKEGKLLPDSAAANSEILFALMMNPALMGADTPGGPYSGGAGSGSNIREAYLVQVMQLEIERGLISKPFEIAKHYNGWDKSIVLRYPNQVLTTLNTGANSQPIS